jgi:hypothetical protein
VNSYYGRTPTLDELKREIAKKVEKNLAAAPFPKDVAYASKVACNVCAYNTGNQDVLFDGAESGHCTFSTCFAAKLKEFYRQLAQAGKKKWPDLKYIGEATCSYGDVQQIKGYAVVEERDPKIQKLLKEKPDLFGIGILKPSNWGTLKKAKIVLLTKDLKLAGVKPREAGYRPPSPEEEMHRQFVEKYVAAEQAIVLFTKADFDASLARTPILECWENAKWTREIMGTWIHAAGIDHRGELDVNKPVDVKDETINRLFLWLILMVEQGWEGALESIAEHNKIDLKEIRKRAHKMAEAEWKAQKDPILAGLKANAEKGDA